MIIELDQRHLFHICLSSELFDNIYSTYTKEIFFVVATLMTTRNFSWQTLNELCKQNAYFDRKQGSKQAHNELREQTSKQGIKEASKDTRKEANKHTMK